MQKGKKNPRYYHEKVICQQIITLCTRNSLIYTDRVDVYKLCVNVYISNIKENKYMSDVEKPTTKKCPECGNVDLILCRSMKTKTCVDSSRHVTKKNVTIPWYLEEGQKPVGY